MQSSVRVTAVIKMLPPPNFSSSQEYATLSCSAPYVIMYMLISFSAIASFPRYFHGTSAALLWTSSSTNDLAVSGNVMCACSTDSLGSTFSAAEENCRIDIAQCSIWTLATDCCQMKMQSLEQEESCAFFKTNFKLLGISLIPCHFCCILL